MKLDARAQKKPTREAKQGRKLKVITEVATFVTIVRFICNVKIAMAPRKKTFAVTRRSWRGCQIFLAQYTKTGKYTK
jgi:hypothetical protein